MPLLDVRSGQDGVVYLAGELDMACVDLFMSAVGARAVRDRPITLDLERLTFLDSTGLQCILMLSEDDEIVLRSPQPQIRRLLSIADIDRWPGIRVEA